MVAPLAALIAGLVNLVLLVTTYLEGIALMGTQAITDAIGLLEQLGKDAPYMAPEAWERRYYWVVSVVMNTLDPEGRCIPDSSVAARSSALLAPGDCPEPTSSDSQGL